MADFIITRTSWKWLHIPSRGNLVVRLSIQPNNISYSPAARGKVNTEKMWLCFHDELTGRQNILGSEHTDRCVITCILHVWWSTCPHVVWGQVGLLGGTTLCQKQVSCWLQQNRILQIWRMDQILLHRVHLSHQQQHPELLLRFCGSPGLQAPSELHQVTFIFLGRGCEPELVQKVSLEDFRWSHAVSRSPREDQRAVSLAC